ncbi:unnamed protein product [Urochloa decumbens]|uniref:C2 NT-type domain-containing protein n=1 Tax=Urochloa decumbens TaxID=240449 RepID=A0ABC9FVT3_9POAL
MAEDPSLSELDALSHTMYQAHTKRRTASLVLLRSPGGDGNNAAAAAPAPAVAARPLSRRLSMSPFRSRPKQDKNLNDDDDHDDDDDSEALPSKSQSFAGVGSAAAAPTAGGKKGIWGWKPIRALSHIGMHRVGCLFSVEVVAAQGLPPSMNGLRLAVSVRKKETRDGAVQTMPSRVVQGGADFEETLFLRCHLYCTGGGGGAGNNKPVRFEPKPFIVSAVAVEAPELDLGRNAVDLSALVRESSEKSRHGERVRQWDMAFPLAGKAKGGELLVKISFQVMDDGGVGLYSQPAVVGGRTSTSSSSSSTLFARKQSKSSFSIASPKVARPEPAITPSKPSLSPELLGIDDFKLDEPEPSPVVEEEVKEEQEQEQELDDEFPEFDIVDKGVEGGQEEEKDDDPPKEEQAEDIKKEAEVEDVTAEADDGEEVVKEVVHDSARTWRLNELEAITNQIKALENMMHGGDGLDPDAADSPERHDDEVVAALDADEEEVTREFLMLLEQGGDNEDGAAAKPTGPPRSPATSSLKSGKKPGADADATCYISDLGKVLGPVVQTRDGGYLAAMNPFDVPVLRKDLPKLAMQLSKPFLLLDQRLPGGGAEVFQRLCAGAGGSDALCARLAALVAMDDLVGKTAEQIAFEGMASAIITARGSRDGHLVATSTSAAQAVSVLRTMSAATSHGRQDRVATGIWNAHENPVAVDEVLAFALQKIESMAVEALKVQADMADDQAPFEVSPEKTAAAGGHVLDAAVPPEEWASACAGADAVSLLVVVQLRDPLRRYEAVGAPSVVVVQAARAAGVGDDEERRFKVSNLHLGGLRLRSPDRRNMWDGEKQRLTAMHWLVAYGLGKVGRKRSAVASGKPGNDVLWSMSSRVMADMWFKPLRNPDVKIPQNQK